MHKAKAYKPIKSAMYILRFQAAHGNEWK